MLWVGPFFIITWVPFRLTHTAVFANLKGDRF